jgi:hypothetical protein
MRQTAVRAGPSAEEKLSGQSPKCPGPSRRTVFLKQIRKREDDNCWLYPTGDAHQPCSPPLPSCESSNGYMGSWTSGGIQALLGHSKCENHLLRFLVGGAGWVKANEGPPSWMTELRVGPSCVKARMGTVRRSFDTLSFSVHRRMLKKTYNCPKLGCNPGEFPISTHGASLGMNGL